MIFHRKVNILKILVLIALAILTVWIISHYVDMEPDEGQWKKGPFVTLDEKDPPLGGVVLLEGYSSTSLRLRMWCAVESAARAHPDTPVSLLMTSNVIKDTALLRALKKRLPNFRLSYLDVSRLFHESLLQTWYELKLWQQSYWPKSHLNDVIRWMLLKRYGGIYLDLDVVVLRSLSLLPNCTGLESDRWAAAGVLKFTQDHPVIEACVKHIAEHFDGTVWGANGPELITQVLVELCDLELPSGKTPRCPDVEVMPRKAFYPVPWWDWKLYVTDDEALSRDILGDESVHVLHFWNRHSRHTKIDLNSQQPYAAAARIYCPTTVLHSGSYM